MNEIDTLLQAERDRLVTVLAELDRAGWETPSLCAGWRVRDVAVHLLMPYELSVPRFLVKMAAAHFRFDTLADRWATRDTRSNAHVLDALRATGHGRFRIPGAPPEAPLSHLVIHAQDVYRPLDIDPATDPHAATIVLDQLTSPRARRSLTPGLLDGLTLTASDTDWRLGTGPEVVGTAAALITTIAGRRAAVHELTGSGAAQIRERLLPKLPQRGNPAAA